MTNFIGEPSTVLIKKSCMKDGTLGSRTSEKKYFVSDFSNEPEGKEFICSKLDYEYIYY